MQCPVGPRVLRAASRIIGVTALWGHTRGGDLFGRHCLRVIGEDGRRYWLKWTKRNRRVIGVEPGVIVYVTRDGDPCPTPAWRSTGDVAAPA